MMDAQWNLFKDTSKIKTVDGKYVFGHASNMEKCTANYWSCEDLAKYRFILTQHVTDKQFKLTEIYCCEKCADSATIDMYAYEDFTIYMWNEEKQTYVRTLKIM